jgi:DNA-binding beta-propeller fold protein YncE
MFILLLVPFTLSFASIDVKASVGNATKNRSFANVTQYEFVKNWGGEGDGEGQFERPHDLEFSPTEDKLYVIDRDNQRVQVFDKNGTYLFEWGSEGEGRGEFTLPYGMDVDSEGNVWVADRGGHRIQKFDPEGNFLLEFGSDGTGEGEFSHPRQVAVDEALQYVYVADSRNHRIQKFDINGNFILIAMVTLLHNGNFLGYKLESVILDPEHMAIDSEGNIYVSERTDDQIQVYKPVINGSSTA